MNELTIIRQNGGAYIDSREVAEIIGKRHHNLLRDINGYIAYMRKPTEIKIDCSGFFLESSYFDSTGRELPCYLISKMGCEMVANKLTGEKGVLFTAAYVTRFNELEANERAELEALAAMPAPRLGEYNACARIIMRGLKWLGATPQQIMRFLKNTYEPLGISVDADIDLDDKEPAPRWYRAGEIAERLGINSLYGKPHAQAVACILNENIFIGAEHKRVETDTYGDCTSVRVLYDEDAFFDVMQWLIDNDWPEEIYGFGRTYHVQHFTE